MTPFLCAISSIVMCAERQTESLDSEMSHPTERQVNGSSEGSSLADTTVIPNANLVYLGMNVNQESGIARIPVKVSGDPLISVFGTTVSWTATDGTAEWPSEYGSISGTIKFSDGERQKDILIPLTASPEFPGYKRFTVSLNTGSNYNVGPRAVTTITILGATPPKGPRIIASNRKLSDGRIRVTIVATDANGLRTTKVVTVGP